MTPDQLAWLRPRVPSIEPLPPDTVRPFWSVVIPTHNRPTFLEQALSSVLDQDPGADQMEIIVSDDGVPDDAVQAVIERAGKGRVSYRRHPAALGQFANVNSGIRRAAGRWIHVLHDDDWVLPGFYAQLQESIDPRCGAALTAIRIRDLAHNDHDWPLEQDQPGILANWLLKLSMHFRIQTPAVVVRRDVYEKLGGYNPDFTIPGDWEMWQRIAAHFHWWYEPRSIAFYRIQTASISWDSKKAPSTFAQMRAVIDFVQSYAPLQLADKIKRNSKTIVAVLAYSFTKRALDNKDFDCAARMIIECMLTDQSSTIVQAITALSPPSARL